MAYAYLSKFKITSTSWWNESEMALPKEWNLLGEKEWKVFDVNLQELFLCKDNWKLHLYYYGKHHGRGEIFVLKQGNSFYTQIGTFDIAVMEKNRDYAVVTREDNERCCLGLDFSGETDDDGMYLKEIIKPLLEFKESESEEDLEKVLQLLALAKKIVKKKLGK